MYSVVLMTALAAGSQSADFGWRRGCHGCHGAAYSCHGCYSCYSAGCYGCYGGYRGCYGGYGACYGGYRGCYGGYGACYGGYGTGILNCYGGYSCYGTCYGPCYGSTYNPSVTPYAPQRQTRPNPMVTPPENPMPPPQQQKPVAPPPQKKDPVQLDKKSDISIEDRAMVVLNVPADAVVFVDGIRMKSSSATRKFVTPYLAPGKTYFYDVKAQVVRNGQTIATNQRIYIRRGQQLPVSFADLGRTAGNVIAQGR